VRVKDVGRAELGAETYTTESRYNARDAIGFGVLQLPTANSLQVYRDVTAEIGRLSARFPPGLKVEVAFDTTSVVSESIRDGGDDAGRGDRPGRARHVPLSPELAHDADSPRSRFRYRSSARSRS